MLVDFAQSRRIIGVDDCSAGHIAHIPVGIVQEIGIEEDHLTCTQWNRDDLFGVDIGGIDLETASRLKIAALFPQMAPRHDF